MTDDDIALKLMRLYKELRRAVDPEIRESVCAAIDSLVVAVKQVPSPQPDRIER